MHRARDCGDNIVKRKNRGVYGVLENKEGGQEGLDATVRTGEGTIGPQKYRMGRNWER